jgi:hypothetical protein
MSLSEKILYGKTEPSGILRMDARCGTGGKQEKTAALEWTARIFGVTPDYRRFKK